MFKNITNNFKNGKIEQTIKHLDRSLEIDPDDLIGLRNKGIVLVNLNRYEEAINVIDELLENNPNDSRLLSRKGLSLEILGRHLEALEYLDRSLEIDPDDLIGLRNKGIVLVNLNRYEEATKVIDRVLAIDPNDSEILLFKAIALESQGLDGKKFIPFYEKSMKINSNDYEMLCNIGFHITQMGGYLNAIQYFDRALSLEPNNPVAINGKSWAFHLQKLNSEKKDTLVKNFSTEFVPR
jgi:tetratricopeptide (TPR) repeat protein